MIFSALNLNARRAGITSLGLPPRVVLLIVCKISPSAAALECRDAYPLSVTVIADGYEIGEAVLRS